MLATRLSVNASNRGDSLAVYASAEDLYAGVLHLPRLSLTGGARQSRVQLSAGFDDTLRRVSGLVGFRAAVADEHGPNGRVVDLRILPSHITRGDEDVADFRPQDPARHRAGRDRQVLRDEPRAGAAARRRRLAQPRGFGDAARCAISTWRPSRRSPSAWAMYIEGRTNGSAAMKSVLRVRARSRPTSCSTAWRSTTFPRRRCASPRAGTSPAAAPE